MLTPTEYAILCLLARNAGKVVTQDELVTEVWGEERLGSGRILEAVINPLRKKIEDDTPATRNTSSPDRMSATFSTKLRGNSAIRRASAPGGLTVSQSIKAPARHQQT